MMSLVCWPLSRVMAVKMILELGNKQMDRLGREKKKKFIQRRKAKVRHGFFQTKRAHCRETAVQRNAEIQSTLEGNGLNTKECFRLKRRGDSRSFKL